MDVWTKDQVVSHRNYSVLDNSNPLYVLWKSFSGRELCRRWRRSYVVFAVDVLNSLGEPFGLAIEKIDETRPLGPDNVQWSSEMSTVVENKPRHGRPRREGFANRAPSFQKPNPDGSFTIGGRKYASKYQYEKYRRYVNYTAPVTGERMIEGVHFYLGEDGRVHNGPAR
jgi:hypothetical protein